jgi:hypothetical protein
MPGTRCSPMYCISMQLYTYVYATKITFIYELLPDDSQNENFGRFLGVETLVCPSFRGKNRRKLLRFESQSCD